MDLGTLVGAGGTLEVGGKLLTLRALTAHDLGAVDSFVRERVPHPMAQYVDEMKYLVPLKAIDPEAYQKASDQALLRAQKMLEERRQGQDREHALKVQTVAESLDTVAYMLWLSCRKDQPDETYESIKEKLASEDLEKVKQKLDYINHHWLKSMQPTGNGAGGEGAEGNRPAPVPA